MKAAIQPFATIDEYIQTFPPEVQARLQKVRQTIRKAAPQAVEGISYQMPAFKLHGQNLVYFAGYKRHIGFYPVPSGVPALEKELAPFVQGRGSVQFPLDRPLPYELVKKIVAYRLKGILGKGK